MIKKLLLVTLAFTAGFLGFSAYTGQLSQLTQIITTTAQPLINTLQPIITQIQTTWSTIPDSIRGIILLGIPSSFAVFFAWTKTRAMEKLQQTKLEASQQITRLVGEASESKGKLENQLEVKETEVKTLRQQVTDIPGQYTQRVTDLKSTVTDLEKRNVELQNEYEILKALKKVAPDQS